MAVNPMDPSVLTGVVERKGSLSLRSNHMHYGKATLHSNWHHDREAEPKDYAIGEGKEKWDLLKATYTRIGNVVDGPLPETTTKSALKEAQSLQEEFKTRSIHKAVITADNFDSAMSERNTGHPQRGYGSILPHHSSDHRAIHLQTTQRADYVYPFDWSPKEEEGPTDSAPETKHRRLRSEFADTAGHRRPGWNTWQDCDGSLRSHTVQQQQPLSEGWLD